MKVRNERWLMTTYNLKRIWRKCGKISHYRKHYKEGATTTSSEKTSAPTTIILQWQQCLNIHLENIQKISITKNHKSRQSDGKYHISEQEKHELDALPEDEEEIQ